MVSDTALVLLALGLPLLIPLTIVVFREGRKRMCGQACMSAVGWVHAVQTYITDEFLRRWGRTWLLVQIGLSFISAGVYVCGLYVDDASDWVTLVVWLEGLFAAFFAVDYVLFFFVARHKVRYFFTFFALIDVYTILPFVIMQMAGTQRVTRSSSTAVRTVAALRVLRVLRTHRMLAMASGSLQRQMWVVSLTIFNFLFCFTCFIQIVEDSPDHPFPFHDSLWFTVITSTTVGYGDISPTTHLGRVVVLAVMFLGIVLIPTETGKLIALANKRNPYKSAAYVHRPNTTHVVVLGSGEDSIPSILGFLYEFYHEDNGLHNYRMALMLDCFPTEVLRRTLANPFFAHRVVLLQGSALDDAGLSRTGIDTAASCFIITPKSAPNAWAQDIVTIMRCVAVRAANPSITIISQLLRRINITHLTAAGCDYILCLDEIKMGVMASNALTPGLSTFLINLLRSFSDDAVDYPPASWEAEYASGYAQEMYSRVTTTALEGLTFADAAFRLYDDLGITLFAVQATVLGVSRAWLNPGASYTLLAGDTVFLLAPDPAALASFYFVDTNTVSAAPLPPSPTSVLDALATAPPLPLPLGAALTTTNPPGYPRAPGTPRPPTWLDKIRTIVSSVLLAPVETSQVTTAHHFTTSRAAPDAPVTSPDAPADPHYHASVVPPWASSAHTYLTHPYSVEESMWLDFSSHASASLSASHARALPMRLRFRTSFTRASLLVDEPDGTPNGTTGGSSGDSDSDSDAPCDPMAEAMAEARSNTSDASFKAPEPLPQSSGSGSGEESGSDADTAVCAERSESDSDSGVSGVELFEATENVWTHVYAMREHPRSKRACTFVADQPIGSHVIVAGTLSGMASFLLTLRVRKQVVQVPILVVHDAEPNSALWHVIRRLDDVYFFKGNYMSVTDLAKAGAERALRVIILGSERRPGEGEPAVVADSDAIFTARLLARLVPHRSDLVFTELSNSESIRYLTAELEEDAGSDSLPFATPFAAGHTFTSTILDTMLVQVFVNSDVVDLVRQCIGLGDHALFSHLSSAPYQIAVPPSVIGRPYVHLAKYLLLVASVVPLALYRKTTPDPSAPTPASAAPASRYIYTNPNRDTVVRADDRVLVLARDPSVLADIVDGDVDSAAAAERSHARPTFASKLAHLRHPRLRTPRRSISVTLVSSPDASPAAPTAPPAPARDSPLVTPLPTPPPDALT